MSLLPRCDLLNGFLSSFSGFVRVVSTTDRKGPTNMRRSLLFFASTAGLLCLAATQARADQSSSNIAWSYNFTPNQTFVSAASPGTGTVSFTNEPTKNASGSSDVVVTNLKVSSTAPAGTPDTFGSGGAWKVGLVLSDAASGTNSGTLWFTGQLGGNFSSSNSNVTS